MEGLLMSSALSVKRPVSRRTRVPESAPHRSTQFAGIAVPELAREVRVKVASTPVEWQQALRLVAECYL